MRKPFSDSMIPLLSKSKISRLLSSSVAVQPGLYRTWSETPKTGFLRTRLKYDLHMHKVKTTPMLKTKQAKETTAVLPLWNSQTSETEFDLADNKVSQSRVIIYTNCVVLEPLMPYVKFQYHRTLNSDEKAFLKILTINGLSCPVGHVTWTIYTIFYPPFPWRLRMQFCFDW